MAKPENHNRQTSTVDNTESRYDHVGTVYNAPVSHQTIVQDNSVTYDVDPEDTDFIERVSMFLMNTLGERKTVLGIVVAGLLGAGSLLSSMYQTPAFLAPYSQPLLYIAVTLLLVAAVFWGAVQYRYESRCAKCNTFYAMKEVGTSNEREVAVKGGVRRTTTRTYQCSTCEHQMTKQNNRFIPDEPEQSGTV